MSATNPSTHLFFEAKPRLAAKVGAGGVASTGATTIPHTFVGLDEGDAYIVTVNRTDATGTTKNSASDTETFIGKVSGTNFINCVREVEGAAQAWAADTVLEILVTATGQNKLIEGIELEHNQDGTHKETALDSMITGTEAQGDIIYHNGTIWTRLPKGTDGQILKQASNVPSWGLPGDLAISSQAQGDILYFNGTNWVRLGAGTSGYFLKTLGTGANPAWAEGLSADGWITAGETWTYASASTFTVAGVDVTTKYTKGTRLKFTQTTAKYAVVVASSFSTNTTVTIAVNTDYTIANAAITSPYYSYQASPQGYPTWFAYTPTVSGDSAAGTGTYSSQVGKYKIDGSAITFHAYCNWSNHTGTGALIMTAPLTSKNLSNFYQSLNFGYHGSLTLPASTIQTSAYLAPNSATIALTGLKDGSAPVNVQVDTSSDIMISGTYEYN